MKTDRPIGFFFSKIDKGEPKKKALKTLVSKYFGVCNDESK